MAQSKPIAYPNLVDQINAIAASHAAIHEGIATHADNRRAELEHKRNHLAVTHAAKKLIEGDSKS
jgi:hypothetical protein